MNLQTGSLIFAGMGLLFLLIGILLVKISVKRRKTATMVTTARVVGIQCRRNGKGSRFYYPVFEYYAGGYMRQEESSIGSNPCRYRTGEETELYYDPEHPEKIWTERDSKSMKLLYSIFMGIGGLFFVLGISFWLTGTF